MRDNSCGGLTVSARERCARVRQPHSRDRRRLAVLAAVRAGGGARECPRDRAVGRRAGERRTSGSRSGRAGSLGCGDLRNGARGGTRGRASRTHARPLTSREQQILALVASGTSNKGVARALGVSTNTVKFHLAAAFEKLDVTTRAEAVAQAIRRGELSV
ncbi:MAG: response regulator transcription factor [Gammaproteobacteria bacterium]|nr:MAG: response regulator transcription factor [Gammaproteobacteria bacterium]